MFVPQVGGRLSFQHPVTDVGWPSSLRSFLACREPAALQKWLKEEPHGHWRPEGVEDGGLLIADSMLFPEPPTSFQFGFQNGPKETLLHMSAPVEALSGIAEMFRVTPWVTPEELKEI